MLYTAGSGFANPGSTNGFISPRLTVTVTAGQRVQFTVSQALGAPAPPGEAATALNIYPCYQLTTAASPTNIGFGIFGLTAAAGQRHVFTISGVVTPAAGTYYVGMCGSSTSANWTNNEWGYVSAIVAN